MLKPTAQRRHAISRIGQRYGLKVSRDDYWRACLAIQSGESVFVDKQSNRVSIHDVLIQGVRVRVAYDRQRKRIMTALPEGAWEEGDA